MEWVHCFELYQQVVKLFYSLFVEIYCSSNRNLSQRQLQVNVPKFHIEEISNSLYLLEMKIT